MWRHWRTADREARLARRITLAATALFLLVVCRWRPWDLFVDTGFSNNFYDEQARAFMDGRKAKNLQQRHSSRVRFVRGRDDRRRAMMLGIR